MSMVNVKVESLMRKSESARVIELSEILMRWDHSHSVAHNLNHRSKSHTAESIITMMDNGADLGSLPVSV